MPRNKNKAPARSSVSLGRVLQKHKPFVKTDKERNIVRMLLSAHLRV